MFQQLFRYVICTLFLMAFHSPALAKSAHGVFKVVKGKVELVRKGKSKKARIGMKVLPKDLVKTSKDSRAKIIMVDKNEINVNPETEMEIADYEFNPKAGKKKVLLNILHGKIRAKVKQKYDGDQASKFQVKTKSAVAGVRGTDFFTSYDSAKDVTKVVTFEGRVEFGIPAANGGIASSVMVDVGQASNSLSGDLPSQPIELPKTELKAFDQGSDANFDVNLPDEGSSQAEVKKQPQQQKRPQQRNQEQRRPAGQQAGGPPPPSALPPLPKQPFNGPPRLPFIPECDFCNEVIQDGTRSLILDVQHQ